MAIASPTLFICSGVSAERRKLLNGGSLPKAATPPREFLEREPRNLGDDAINARLEARGDFARDVVLEFVEQVADGEFGKLDSSGGGKAKANTPTPKPPTP